ncbi:MAG: class I SAM-dependent methyltransferase [Deltaproteobacteria bacterium]|jgi:predicted O-methyltransferase YrrM|nr:class I SAM-dependent methyltransferase [Deltaproteobacteria bacterium]
MNTLASVPLAPLLDSLLKEDAASDARIGDLSFSNEEFERLLQSKTEYRILYGRLKDFPLAVSRVTGSLLYVLARACRAREVVEFGTSFGVSTLFLAAALRDNGGGRLITSEFEPSKVAKAKEHLKTGGLIDLVEVREGDALQTLSVDLPDSIDLLLLDGSKALYLEVLAMAENRLRPGALVIADDADRSPEYLSYVRSSVKYISIPAAEDVELSLKLG